MVLGGVDDVVIISLQVKWKQARWLTDRGVHDLGFKTSPPESGAQAVAVTLRALI